MDHFKKHYSQKNHNPVCAPEEQLQASILTNNNSFSSSIVVGDNGKKRFPETFSDTEKFIPGMRLLPHKMHSETMEERGKRPIVPLNSETKVDYKKRSSSESLRRSDSADLPVIHWTRKRTVMLENGEPAYNYQSRVEKLEDTMNQKQRIRSELQRRNFIPTATAGDKSYYEADREPGFYAKGGIIPGSTIQLRKSAKPTLRKSEDISTLIPQKKLEATYAKQQAKLAKEYDVNQVRTVTVSVSLAFIYCVLII